MNNYKTNEVSKILSHPITIVLFSLIFVLFFISLRKNATKTKISTQNISTLENEIQSLEKKIDESQKELEIAQSPLSQEKIIRNELLMQKEGEYIVQLPELKKKEVKNEKGKTSPWEAWRELMF